MTSVLISPVAESSSGSPKTCQACQRQGEDLLLWVIVQPRSSRNAIGDIHDSKLRIRLTAAPVDGKANQALIKLLGKSFGVAASQISIEKGDTSKTKRVRVCSPKILPQFLK